MPPHPEVPAALRRLRDHDFRLFTLTGNTLAISGRQLEQGGIIDLVERRRRWRSSAPPSRRARPADFAAYPPGRFTWPAAFFPPPARNAPPSWHATKQFTYLFPLGRVSRALSAAKFHSPAPDWEQKPDGRSGRAGTGFCRGR
jgi:hypothetical protein